ncbi:hypothetical protein Nepgr_018271 [Nepenthes gracilis]|uniref:Uncharacterized protein n=1 Tax=Nepenthes gracilis TaxID=150966 RepID=A0AAD3SR02_NEPGR|nr:hypothetical protein Nepgr_018271 [Nepenthes gracilis]
MSIVNENMKNYEELESDSSGRQHLIISRERNGEIFLEWFWELNRAASAKKKRPSGLDGEVSGVWYLQSATTLPLLHLSL